MHKHDTHTPVLLNQVIEQLAIEVDDFVVDGTVGCGGHSSKISQLLGPKGKLLMIDEDSNSILKTKEKINRTAAEIFFVEDNFRNLPDILSSYNLSNPTKILLDLGWNITQLHSNRGFSFQEDAELLMTYSRDESKYIFTAKDIVNGWEEKNIADVLYHYADEYFSKRIAKAIVEKRKENEIKTAKELGEIIYQCVPNVIRKRKIHPATKTFQALRIVVNKEIETLNKVLDFVPQMLGKNSRIGIITFHSIEDRVVKNTFAEWEKEGFGKRYSKKPTKPEAEEIKANPLSRSAKLRTFIIN